MTDPNRYTSDADLMLIEAIHDMNVNKMIIALNTGANRNVTDMRTGSPLLFTLIDMVQAEGDDGVHAGRLAAMLVNFIVKRPDANLPDKQGRTPLAYALEIENYFIADLLVTAGADLDQLLPDGERPMHRAVRLAATGQGNRLFSTLLHGGADATLPNAQGLSAFDLAARFTSPVAEGLRAAMAQTPPVQALIEQRRAAAQKTLGEKARRHNLRPGR